MKLNELSDPKVNVLNEPLNSLEVITNRTTSNIQEEPLYICDLTDIIKKHKIWTQYFPRIIPFYAVKCNDNTLTLKILAALGTGFDCASKGEINKVLELGIPTSRIIFANPTKPVPHMCYAAAMNILTMTFDSEIELYKIKKFCPDARLILRIRCDAEVAQCALGAKFGCDPEIEAPVLISLARKLNLQVVGISFHVGSGCMDPPIYAKAIYIARHLFNFAQTLGYSFKILDIGGGFPGDKNTNIKQLSVIINSALNKYFPLPEITIMAEPGRFYVASAFTLACRIHSKREVVKEGIVENVMYFMNDGVYGSFNCLLYDHKIVQPQLIKVNDRKHIKSSLWGPTCDALDLVCENIMLPVLEIDDIIMFENMGAYTLPIASRFNGFPLPKVEYFVEQQYLDDMNSSSIDHFINN